jgi:hypothetical protein
MQSLLKALVYLLLSAVMSTLGFSFPVSHIPQFQPTVSQRSLHNEPIFRLLLKVAVKGTQQCEFLNFCGALCPNNVKIKITEFEMLYFCVGKIPHGR